MSKIKRFKFFVEDDEPVHPDTGGMRKIPFDKNPKIGWHKDQPDHYVMYHGTHERNLHHIAKHGIEAPTSGPTKDRVSMTHDPHTAHAYAAMSGGGGESAFKGVGQKPTTTPHNKRATVVAHIPKDWAHKHMDHDLSGNVAGAKERMTHKHLYDQHKAAGKPDHEYYQTTELRFKKHIPPEFIKGYAKKHDQ